MQGTAAKFFQEIKDTNKRFLISPLDTWLARYGGMNTEAVSATAGGQPEKIDEDDVLTNGIPVHIFQP